MKRFSKMEKGYQQQEIQVVLKRFQCFLDVKNSTVLKRKRVQIERCLNSFIEKLSIR